jgi:hypothetical protein
MRWLLMPAVVILAALTSSLGKLAIRRPRPDFSYRVLPWGRLGAAAFPSTHSACAFAIAGWLRASRHGRWLHVVAVLIGCSRVRCRAHHSTDVVAGAMLGYGIAVNVERAWSRLVNPRAVRVAANGVGSSEPQAAATSTSREHSPPYGERILALVGREVSHRPIRGRNGESPARRRRGAKGHLLEVG